MPTNYFSGYDNMPVMAEVDSAGNNIAGSLSSINSKIPGEASSSNQLVTKSELAGFGYKVSTADPETGYPDEENPSPHKVYLIKDTEATGDDKYAEWVWSVPEGSSEGSWEMIGETSFELDIDTETFRTSIMIDQNTLLMVDDDTPMVENDDVTLVKAINGDEIVARRAYEDEFGNNIAESVAGKQDKLVADSSDARKCLGVHANGSIGWINGSSLGDGGMLEDGAVVHVPNNARSYLVTSRASITLDVALESGEIPNFVVEITTGAVVSVNVTSSTGEYSTTLKYSVDAGYTLEAGKTYQVTAAGTCWTLAEFVRPDGATYGFGGVSVEFDENGGHASVDASSLHIEITEPIPVTSFEYDRAFAVNKFNTIVLPFSLETSKMPNGLFYEIIDFIYNDEKHSYEACLSQPLSMVEANHPYLYVPTEPDLDVQLSENEYIIIEPTNELVIPLHATTGEWLICVNYNFIRYGDLPGFNEEFAGYGFSGEKTGNVNIGDLVKAGPNATVRPMRMYFKRLLQ